MINPPRSALCLSPHLVDGCCLVLPLVEHLVEAVHGEERDPGHVQLGDDLVCHGGLAAGRAAADPDHEWLDLLALAVVPRRPALRVDRALGRADDGFPLRADGRVGGQRSLPLIRLIVVKNIYKNICY